MPDLELKAAGDDSFIFGADSSVFPAKLGDGQYVMSMNTINRGGIIQTRPGSASLVLDFIDEDGNITENFDIPGENIQGITLFVPSSGSPALVFVVDGIVYASHYPFSQYKALEGLRFSKYSKYVAFESCVQSTDYDGSGLIINLDTPKRVLIIQDGNTRAAYWDGSTAEHIDPTPSNSEFTAPGKDGTPVGLWMIWSNNRLWVSRKDMIFASDIGNPLKFTETQYLNEARAFFLPGPCTGIVETPDQQGILCFTPEKGVFLRSAIQDRTQWLQTPEFQKTVLPSIGCVSPRSIVQQHGLIWWMTPKGLISLNDAAKLNVSSRLNAEDQEMASSKHNMSHDISMVCGSFFDNFLFHAVPVGDKYNTRVHVLDQAPTDQEGINSWPSYWEGWRPVEFARAVTGSEERVFCISKDLDGVNRIWELFLKDRTDNRIPITSYVQTKLHLFDSREYKRFHYAEVEAVGITGDTSFMLAAGGLRGAFQTVGTKEVKSQIGQVYPDELYGEGDNLIFGVRPQTRIIRTKDTPEVSDCNSECIESDKRGLVDKGFSLLVVWSGIAGISSYRIFAQYETDANLGRCEEDETGVKLLTPEGCGSTDEFSTSVPFTTYESSQTYSQDSVSETSSAASVISQADADRKALATAKWKVQAELGEIVLEPSSRYEGIVPSVPLVLSINHSIFD
jgi:hypothetical protein